MEADSISAVWKGNTDVSDIDVQDRHLGWMKEGRFADGKLSVIEK